MSTKTSPRRISSRGGTVGKMIAGLFTLYADCRGAVAFFRMLRRFRATGEIGSVTVEIHPNDSD